MEAGDYLYNILYTKWGSVYILYGLCRGVCGDHIMGTHIIDCGGNRGGYIMECRK